MMQNEAKKNEVTKAASGRVDLLVMRFRYFLIEMLAGDMPIVMNVNIARPKGFIGALSCFPYPKKPAIFTKNVLLHEERKNIITPTRDVDESY